MLQHLVGTKNLKSKEMVSLTSANQWKSSLDAKNESFNLLQIDVRQPHGIIRVLVALLYGNPFHVNWNKFVCMKFNHWTIGTLVS